MVGVPRGECGLEDCGLGDSGRGVGDAGAQLGEDDAPLLLQGLVVDRPQEVAHAIALQPQRELEPLGRDGRKIEGGVGAGDAVEVGGAAVREQAQQGPSRDVGRSLVGEVLDEVGDAGEARGLVGGAHVIPHHDSHVGEGVVRREEHLEAVLEAELFDR